MNQSLYRYSILLYSSLISNFKVTAIGFSDVVYDDDDDDADIPQAITILHLMINAYNDWWLRLLLRRGGVVRTFPLHATMASL